MVDPVTPNIGLNVPTHGSDVGTWDASLNQNALFLDVRVGGTTTLISSQSPTGATLAPLQMTKRVVLTGVLSQQFNLTMPSSIAGGSFVADNQTTGNFPFIVQTSLPGRTASIPQGGRSYLVCDGTNVDFGDDNQKGKFLAEFGPPTGFVAGTAATASGQASNVVWDAVNYILSACTLSGSATTAQWTAVAPNMVVPQGYLTPISNQPVTTADSIAATQLFYTPFVGDWAVASNGTAVYPFPFTEMALALTGSHTANNIFDVYLFNNNGTMVVGTGPAWSVSTAGLGSRGAAAALIRFDGVLTNAAQILLTNGLSTYTVPTNQGIYVASIFTDASAGQVTCHRGYGQSRKWGIWNYYNRLPIYLKGGDPTTAWFGTTPNTWHASNNNANNKLTFFQGVAEEYCTADFIQHMEGFVTGSNATGQIGIALNGVTLTQLVGKRGNHIVSGNVSSELTAADAKAAYRAMLSIGINTITAMELANTASTTSPFIHFFGTEADYLLTANWRG